MSSTVSDSDRDNYKDDNNDNNNDGGGLEAPFQTTTTTTTTMATSHNGNGYTIFCEEFHERCQGMAQATFDVNASGLGPGRKKNSVSKQWEQRQVLRVSYWIVELPLCVHGSANCNSLLEKAPNGLGKEAFPMLLPHDVWNNLPRRGVVVTNANSWTDHGPLCCPLACGGIPWEWFPLRRHERHVPQQPRDTKGHNGCNLCRQHEQVSVDTGKEKNAARTVLNSH